MREVYRNWCRSDHPIPRNSEKSALEVDNGLSLRLTELLSRGGACVPIWPLVVRLDPEMGGGREGGRVVLETNNG